MSSINYSDKIPNNVNLSEDRTLQRALEGWQPNFINWWGDVGPEGSSNFDVYLRTAISVDPQGWAHFGYVKMPDYRWGIFMNPGDAERKIHFGDHLGEKAWQANRDKWLPTAEDRAFVASLMGRVVEPGKFANWIAPPAVGVNRQPIDFEYVRFN